MLCFPVLQELDRVEFISVEEFDLKVQEETISDQITPEQLQNGDDKPESGLATRKALDDIIPQTPIPLFESEFLLW